MAVKIHEIHGYIMTIYLVEDNESLLLLDGCSRADIKIVKKYIEQDLNKSLSDLKLVISTHSHPDHMGGLGYFKSKGISIAGPKNLGRTYKGFFGWVNYIVDIFLSHLVAINKNKGFKNLFFRTNIELDYVLLDKMRIPGFKEWQCISAPGHTSIDLSIYNERESVAYVADNFIGVRDKIYRPYPIHHPSLYKKSLRKYLDLNIETYLLAHYGKKKITKDQIQKIIDSTSNRPKKHRNTLAGIIFKLVKSFLFKFRNRKK